MGALRDNVMTPHMAEAAASWFIPLPAGTCSCLLNPCAGEGEIACLLGGLLNYEAWNCEMIPYRAESTSAHQPGNHSLKQAG